MRIIQSFWSKPLLNQIKENSIPNNYAGWLSLEALLASWVLSCLTIKKFYPELILYTDEFGKKLLIDILELPYSDYHVVFEDIEQFDHSFWAMGKIYVYSLQKKPFIHIDGDIFIWEKFSSIINNAEIFSQNIERNNELYFSLLKDVQDKLNDLPKEIENCLDVKPEYFGINTGVFGGNNIKLINLYAKKVLKFAEINQKNLIKHKIKHINVFFEQYLLKCFIDNYKPKLTCLFETLSNDFNELLDFHLVPFSCKYVHAVGYSKLNPIANEQILIRLYMEDIYFYEKVQNTIPIIKKSLNI
jgi:hypothetical protein